MEAIKVKFGDGTSEIFEKGIVVVEALKEHERRDKERAKLGVSFAKKFLKVADAIYNTKNSEMTFGEFYNKNNIPNNMRGDVFRFAMISEARKISEAKK